MSDIQLILGRFKRAKGPKLELSNKGLTYIPNDIYSFTQLNELDLSNNQISSIDSKIQQLENLSVLNLQANKLMSIPESVLNLKNLKILKVDGNPLTKVFEPLLKLENQCQPRLGQALKVVFGLSNELEEVKDNEDFQNNVNQQPNQGNLMMDVINKDQEIMQLKKANSELQKQLQSVSLTRNNSQSKGKLQISPRTKTVLEAEFNELEIGKEIGMGGFSTVHCGKFKGCQVAIKKIFNPKITDELLDEVNNEVNMLASLRHPNIILLMGIVDRPPNLCIITELSQKGDLYSLLHRNVREKIPGQIKKQIAKQIAETFAFIHGNKIVHRDLKSLNILLDNNYNVKVCDFGLARRFDEIQSSASKFSGTPAYMALELYQKKGYDHKVDVFAFGTLLWEIYARQEPFAGLEPNTIMEKVQKNEQLPANSGIPDFVQNLVRSCRDINPEKRPSFEQISQEIQYWPDI